VVVEKQLKKIHGIKKNGAMIQGIRI
jgi:hypothetical protein